MSLQLIPVTLQFRSTFRISREAKDTSDSLIVAIGDGIHTGYGEAASHRYYRKTIASLSASLEKCRAFLAGVNDYHPEELWPGLLRLTDGDTFALSALDNALWDLWGRRQGKPLFDCWGLSVDQNVASDITIGIGPIEEMAEKLNEYSGWPVYKIKLGAGDDLAIMQALRDRTDAVLRVDANCAWSAETGVAHAEALAALDVEFIEQPLKADDWAGMKTLHESSPLPLIADESCVVEKDVERCAEVFHGINIKLMKCGGLTPARRMITRAHEMNLSVMVGCMSECTVGMSAIAQILPLLDAVDMDGAALISNDPADGVRVEQGICRYPERNGLGVEVKSAEILTCED